MAVQLYTGDGKGKTTAAFGLALRSAGHGQRVFIAQFMKGRPYGELRAVSAIPNIEVARFGWNACIRREDISEFHIQGTRDGLETCERMVASGRYSLLVLDEILVAQWFGLVGLEELSGFISRHRHQAELLLTGDGSFLMNMQELATLAEEELDVKIILFDNRSLGLVHQQQDLFYGSRFIAVNYPKPVDFAGIAGCFGIPSTRLSGSENPAEALRQALRTPGPHLIHAPVDVYDKVFPMVVPGGANSQMLTRTKWPVPHSAQKA